MRFIGRDAFVTYLIVYLVHLNLAAKHFDMTGRGALKTTP